jgi:hypothetical protein
MADFNAATLDATVESLRSGLTTLNGHLNRVGPATRAATSVPLMPDFIKDGLVWCGERLVEIGSAVLDKIGELLLGALAPGAFFFRAMDWHDSVGGPASDVAGAIHPNALRATRSWSGDAASSYSASVAGQTTAASAIQAVSSSAATALVTCAVAGLAFYVALAAILVKLIAATAAAIAAFGSVVFSWAGVAIIIEEAAVNSALIFAAIGTLMAVLGAQGNAIVQMKSTVTSGAAFPGGAWPVGTA